MSFHLKYFFIYIQSPDKLLDNDPEFFHRFNLVIGVHLPERYYSSYNTNLNILFLNYLHGFLKCIIKCTLNKKTYANIGLVVLLVL